MKAFSTRNLASGPLAARMLALTIALAATSSTAQSVGWQARWDGGLVDSAAAGWDIAQGLAQDAELNVRPGRRT